jgi:hypothetical protein
MDDGFAHLLTEETLRFALIRSLADSGLPTSQLQTEYRIPDVGSVDLWIDGDRTIAVELKYPRDPSNFGAADTMTLGELIKDFYKTALAPASSGIVIQLTDERLRRYLSKRSVPEPQWNFDEGSHMLLTQTSIDALPKTARTVGLHEMSHRSDVTGRCYSSISVDDWLLVTWSVRSTRPGRSDPSNRSRS